MDQGAIVEPDDRRTWTPLRTVLLALSAIGGGILLSVALSGPAHADTLGDPPQPAASSADGSVVGRLSGVLTDVTRTALAPVDDLVATVTPAVDARPVAPSAAPPAPVRHAGAASASPASTGTIPAALDTVLAEVPVAPAPLWQSIIGPRPVQSVATPLAAVLRPLAPGAADLLAPPPTVAAPRPLAAAAAAAAGSPRPPVAPGAPAVARGAMTPPDPTAAGPATGRHAVPPPAPPWLPLGASDDAVAIAPAGGAFAPAILAAVVAALLLVVIAARRRGWTLPSAPAFGADVSPD